MPTDVTLVIRMLRHSERAIAKAVTAPETVLTIEANSLTHMPTPPPSTADLWSQQLYSSTVIRCQYRELSRGHPCSKRTFHHLETLISQKGVIRALTCRRDCVSRPRRQILWLWGIYGFTYKSLFAQPIQDSVDRGTAELAFR